MSKINLLLFVVVLTACSAANSTLVRNFDKIGIHIEPSVDGQTVYTLRKDGNVLQQMTINHDFGDAPRIMDIDAGFELIGNGGLVRFELTAEDKSFSMVRVSRNVSTSEAAIDCTPLNTGRTAWYGGPSLYHRYWPMDKLTLNNYSMTSRQSDYGSIADRYWLNSKGIFFFVDKHTPNFVHQNYNYNKTLCFVAQNALPFNVRRSHVSLIYYIGSDTDMRAAHLQAVNRLLGKPAGEVDRRMIQHPVWSTWARYKKDVDEPTVESFANEILKNGFNNSQLEIDDIWESCYGSLEFSKIKFPNARRLMDKLHQLGFRITVWVHPFINEDCDPWYSEALSKGYFVKNHKNETTNKAWVGVGGHVDFTNTAAFEWFRQRLETLKRTVGIDSFKFDAGESDWAPADPQLNSSVELHPGALLAGHMELAYTFGPFVEVRVGQNTQHMPMFVRMMDKDSHWTINNGLASLVTSLLHMNMAGYPYILPDMIGGNGYGFLPSKELFIRWLQANVFMPSIQYSYVPWEFDDETTAICRKYTDMHASILDRFVHQMNVTISTGEPLNLPIWWLDPNDTIAQQVDDEFLLGTTLLAAPVLIPGAIRRNIYLPRGLWYDPKLNRNVIGPTWLMDYEAPLDVLPYFILQ